MAVVNQAVFHPPVGCLWRHSNQPDLGWCWKTHLISPVVSEIFNVEKCRDHEIRARGHSRSSEPTCIDPPPVASY